MTYRSTATTVLAALAPFGVGIAVVSSGTEYIASALSQVARILTGIGVVVVLVGAFVGYAVARSALAPAASRAASGIGAATGWNRVSTMSHSTAERPRRNRTAAENLSPQRKDDKLAEKYPAPG